MVFSVCFLNSPCNKKYPKNKSSSNVLKFLYDFLKYLRIIGTENTPGGHTTWPRGSRAHPPSGARPLPRGPHVPPSTYSSTHTLLLPVEKIPPSSNPCSSSSCCDFRSPCSKLHSQNCFGGLFLGM